MSALYLPRARRPEALAWVVAVPQVEVAHLRSLDRDDAHHRAGLDRPCVPAADGNDVVVHAPPAVAGLRDALVEATIEVEASRRIRVAVQPHRAHSDPRQWHAARVRAH